MRALGVGLQVGWLRAGWLSRAVVCAVAVIVLLAVGSELQKQQAIQLDRAVQAERAMQAARALGSRAETSAETMASRATEGVSAMRAVLGRSQNVERDVQVIFDRASGQGLVLPQGRYKVAENRAGGFQQLQIDLPVKGSYGAIRRFVEAVLIALPHAALEDVRLRRKTAGTSELEAQLRFMLYLDAVSPLVPVDNAGSVAATGSRQ